MMTSSELRHLLRQDRENVRFFNLVMHVEVLVETTSGAQESREGHASFVEFSVGELEKTTQRIRFSATLFSPFLFPNSGSPVLTS